jgi:hypothetical protein
MNVFWKSASSQALFPKDRIKSRITLKFRDEANGKAYNNFFITSVRRTLIELGICNLSILVLFLGASIIIGVLLKKPDGIPVKMMYIAVPAQIAVTCAWVFLSLRFPKLRGYAGMVPTLEWIVFLTEYVCYGKKEFVLPPGSILIYMSVIIYGSLLSNMWIKPSISFLLGNIYFITRTLTNLRFNEHTSKTEFILTIACICGITSWTFYFFDLKFRRDFLDIMDKDETQKFTSFFLEHIPIGIAIYNTKGIVFINSEFRKAFTLKESIPQDRLTNDVNINVFSKLINVDSKTSLLNEIQTQTNFNYKVYSFGNQEFKVVPKVSEYSKNNFNILCFFDVTEIKKLEKEKVEKRLQTTLMATMSHELRTPLNGIIGNVKSIKDSSSTSVYQSEISSIDSCSTILLMKVNDMLVNSII